MNTKWIFTFILLIVCIVSSVADETNTDAYLGNGERCGSGYAVTPTMCLPTLSNADMTKLCDVRTGDPQFCTLLRSSNWKELTDFGIEHVESNAELANASFILAYAALLSSGNEEDKGMYKEYLATLVSLKGEYDSFSMEDFSDLEALNTLLNVHSEEQGTPTEEQIEIPSNTDSNDTEIVVTAILEEEQVDLPTTLYTDEWEEVESGLENYQYALGTLQGTILYTIFALASVESAYTDAQTELSGDLDIYLDTNLDVLYGDDLDSRDAFVEGLSSTLIVLSLYTDLIAPILEIESPEMSEDAFISLVLDVYLQVLFGTDLEEQNAFMNRYGNIEPYILDFDESMESAEFNISMTY